MTILELERRLAAFVAEDPGNRVEESYALRPEYVGTPIYETPLIGCAAADDPLFAYMKQRADIYGPTLRLPEEWLPVLYRWCHFSCPIPRRFGTATVKI